VPPALSKQVPAGRVFAPLPALVFRLERKEVSETMKYVNTVQARTAVDLQIYREISDSNAALRGFLTRERLIGRTQITAAFICVGEVDIP